MQYYISIVLVTVVSYYGIKSECTWKDGGHETSGRLAPLQGQRFTAEDPDNKFSYSIGICSSALSDDATSDIGVLQTTKDGTKTVGKYSSAEIKIGTNWMLLEYNGGDNYGTHCGKEERRANIFITCNKKQTNGIARVVEENTNRTANCYYLFEIEHALACQIEKSSLGTGTVIFIILLVLIAVYLVGGFLFQRYFAGAKGIEQIPHLSFWRKTGNFLADGCDIVCRCGGGVEPEARQYRGIGGDDVHEEDITVEHDENLLPM